MGTKAYVSPAAYIIDGRDLNGPERVKEGERGWFTSGRVRAGPAGSSGGDLRGHPHPGIILLTRRRIVFDSVYAYHIYILYYIHTV